MLWVPIIMSRFPVTENGWMMTWTNSCDSITFIQHIRCVSHVVCWTIAIAHFLYSGVLDWITRWFLALSCKVTVKHIINREPHLTFIVFIRLLDHLCLVHFSLYFLYINSVLLNVAVLFSNQSLHLLHFPVNMRHVSAHEFYQISAGAIKSGSRLYFILFLFFLFPLSFLFTVQACQCGM